MRWIKFPTSPLRRLLCLGVESALLSGAFLISVALRFWGDPAAEEHYPLLLPKAALASLVLQLSLYYADLYEDYASPGRAEMLLRLAKAFFGGTLVLAILFYAFPAIRFGRGIVVFFIPLSLVGILLWRMACLHLWGQEGLGERLLVLGTGPLAESVVREMEERAHIEFRLVGLLGELPAPAGRHSNPLVIGTMARLGEIVEREGVDRIVVALDDFRGNLPVSELLRIRLAGVRIDHAATFFERVTGRIVVRDLRPSWFIFSGGFDQPQFFQKTKRIIEAACALVGLLVAFPLILLMAVLVKLEGGGPVFYRQERVGEGGRSFNLFKLRSMSADAESATGPVWSRRDGDPRVTRVGWALRKLRLDELPQLWNVLRGEMSFVGPRPERPHFVDQLRQVIPYYDERHTVKPGITGWAQIKYGYGSNLEDAEEKLQYDLYYVKHMSWWFDLQIVLHTVKVMALGRGAR